ncbi:MAG: cytochrome c biogenesis CcdA family protein [Fidelibacterota bacterium]
MDVDIWVAFGAGFLSFVSPCVLPLFPSYLGYITGMSIEELAPEKARQEVRWLPALHAALFILGFSVVFISMGAAATTAGKFLVRNRDILERIGGAIIILMGLFILGAVRPFFMNREWHPGVGKKGQPGFLMSFLVGIGFGSGWSPCIGPLLGTILVMAADGETVGSGVRLLSFYSLGLAVPFLAGALGLGWALDFFRRMTRFLKPVRIVSGLLVTVVGVLVFLGYYGKLTQYLATP